jgi:hypothetical protein
MPITSRRQLALADLKDRLSWITKANSYSSDAGNLIFLGEVKKLGKDDPEAALCIIPACTEPPDGKPFTTGGTVRYKLPVHIHGIAKVARNSSPLEVFEGLIADIKQAVEIEGNDPGHPLGKAWKDRYLGVIPDSAPPSPATLSRGLERDSEVTHYEEGGSVITGVTVTYVLFMEEKWGQP